MEEMTVKVPRRNLAYYVNMKTIEAIHRALDIPLSKTITTNDMNGVRASVEEEDGEEVEEDVIDDFTEDQSVCWQSHQHNTNTTVINIG